MSDNSAQVPQHVAIIMDGNGRWAQKRLMPRTYGHKKGVSNTVDLLEQEGSLEYEIEEK